MSDIPRGLLSGLEDPAFMARLDERDRLVELMCGRREAIRRRCLENRTHGHAAGSNENGTRFVSREYRSWRAMKERCLNPNHVHYKNYGGRQIKICARWENSFVAFLEDMGPRPAGTSIDRVNNDLGYFKENCRWSSIGDQNRNRRPHKRRPFSAETRAKMSAAAKARYERRRNSLTPSQ